MLIISTGIFLIEDYEECTPGERVKYCPEGASCVMIRGYYSCKCLDGYEISVGGSCKGKSIVWFIHVCSIYMYVRKQCDLKDMFLCSLYYVFIALFTS